MVKITFKFVNCYGVKYITWLTINDSDFPFNWKYNITCNPHACNSGIFYYEGDYNEFENHLLQLNNDWLKIIVQRFDK